MALIESITKVLGMAVSAAFMGCLNIISAQAFRILLEDIAIKDCELYMHLTSLM